MKIKKNTFIALFSIGLFTDLASTATVESAATSNDESTPTEVQLVSTSHKVKISIPTNG